MSSFITILKLIRKKKKIFLTLPYPLHPPSRRLEPRGQFGPIVEGKRERERKNIAMERTTFEATSLACVPRQSSYLPLWERYSAISPSTKTSNRRPKKLIFSCESRQHEQLFIEFLDKIRKKLAYDNIKTWTFAGSKEIFLVLFWAGRVWMCVFSD